MRRMLVYILCMLMFLTQVTACGTGQEVLPENIPIADAEEDIFSMETLDAMEVAKLESLDNSMDAYSAFFKAPVRMDKPEGAVSGGGMNMCLGESKAYYYKKHLMSVPGDSFDELVSVSVDGTNDSKTWPNAEQKWDIGAVLGTNHYLAYNFRSVEAEDGTRKYSYFFEECDEEHNVLREIPLPFFDSEEVELVSHLIMDSQERVHFTLFSGEQYHYYVVTSEGELLLEYSSEDYNILHLTPAYDGRILLAQERSYPVGTKIEKLEYRIEYADPENGEVVLLKEWEEPYNGHYYWHTLWDEGHFLYVDATGLYTSELDGSNPQLLYKWMNHGIILAKALDLRILPENKIAIFYSNGGEYYYLCLEPTKEQMEIQEIILACSPGMEGLYKQLVADFNKKYPTCHLEIKADYEQTPLLTELIAGKGPILIDTTLTGFENQKDLWQPLDEVFAELGIASELQMEAMELGKIDGKLYGVVNSFWIETVVTADKELQDWDYDTFLQCIGERANLRAIVNSEYLDSDASRVVSNFLVHGIEDNYFFDAETGEMYFDTEEFRKMIRTIKKYTVRKDFVEPLEDFKDGQVLCNTLRIESPEHVALFRMAYGEEVNYIGFPGKDGASHYLAASQPLAIRKTASKEEKEIACAFLNLMLSYEGQSSAVGKANFRFSVRKDVLAEQMNSIGENTFVGAVGFGGMKLGNKVDREKDAATLKALLKNAKPRKYLPTALSRVVFEELSLYFEDEITEDMLIQHLESRVGLYLDEMQ